MSLIINADDFGLDEITTQAIGDSFCLGLINQTTLMVNMPWADQAVELARKQGFLNAIGLHINLTNGVPLTGSIRSNLHFCNENGVFDKRFGKRRRQLFPYSQRDARDIAEEVTAQARKYLEYKLPLLHCDSHHHLHFAIPLLRIILPIVAELGFKTIRRPYNIGNFGLRGTLKNVRGAVFEHFVRRHRLSCGESFSSCAGFVAGFDVALRSQRIELMVHPYYRDGVLIDIVKGDLKEGPPLADTMQSVRRVYAS